MIQKKKNQFKLDKIKQIENENDFIYFFRYNDLNYKDKINLKKEIKNFKFYFLKQNLTKKIFKDLKGQGSLIIFYGDSFLNIENVIQKFKKLEFIKLYNKKNKLIFSNNKLKKINTKNNFFINYQLKKPLFIFHNFLKKII
jgi:ribosomal protein L10